MPTRTSASTTTGSSRAALAQATAVGKPLWLTEFGINDPKMPRARQGRRLRRSSLRAQIGAFVGATYYHLNTKAISIRSITSQPAGDAALSAGLRL